MALDHTGTVPDLIDCEECRETALIGDHIDLLVMAYNQCVRRSSNMHNESGNLLMWIQGHHEIICCFRINDEAVGHSLPDPVY